MDSSRPLPVLPEVDLALVHALQIAPRAPWSAVGRAIGVDPATAARRWRRLSDERLAWFVVRPSAEQLAPERDAVLVNLRCRPGTQVRIAERMAAVPEVYAVDQLAGEDDIAVILIGAGLAATRAAVDALVGDDPDVTPVRVAFVAQVHREDAQWRLSVLSRSQWQALAPAMSGTVPAPDRELTAQLTRALTEDARMSLAELGRRLERPEPTVRRLLDRALRSHAIRLGCDVVASAGGAGRAVLLDVCVDDPHPAGRAIAALPQVLRCAVIVGRTNLAVAARFLSLAELAAFETAAASVAPGWTVRHRATVVRSVKRQGRVLDDEGRIVAPSSSSSR